jgi:RNA polymerase-associated protein CTR9
MDSLSIPIRSSKEVVRVPLHQLPEDVDDILHILAGELAPLDLWLNFAV